MIYIMGDVMETQSSRRTARFYLFLIVNSHLHPLLSWTAYLSLRYNTKAISDLQKKLFWYLVPERAS